MKTRKRIAVLGAGKIGQTLVAGILDAGVAPKQDVMVVTKHRETLGAVTKRFKVRGTLSCAEACEFADVVLISV
jgi:pyrroline-5-carboxylate reductase